MQILSNSPISNSDHEHTDQLDLNFAFLSVIFVNIGNIANNNFDFNLHNIEANENQL